MPRSKPITAAELMQQLEADPQFVARREARQRKSDELAHICSTDEAELVQELRALRYDIDSVYDLVNNDPHPILKRRFLGAYPHAYPTLIKHLKLPHHPSIREGIIRALTVKDGGVAVESALLAEFKVETDPALLWVLANALRAAMPYHRRRKHPEIQRVLKGNRE